jgi:hypothetical protein
MILTLPEGQSAGSVIAALLPASAHYVKALGTLAADALATAANREPQSAVLFYATDDDAAATTIERLHEAPLSSCRATTSSTRFRRTSEAHGPGAARIPGPSLYIGAGCRGVR